MTTDDNPLSPRLRYELHGTFDADTYDDDWTAFPEYFDEEGWPLFGNYDPYALEHPITGRSWLDAPRVPSDDEADPQYGHWWSIACRFREIQLLFAEARILPHIAAASTDDGLWSTRDPGNSRQNYAHDNIAYANRWIVPRFKRLLEARDATAEFAQLWAELKEIALLVEQACTREVAWREQAPGHKMAQLKFYLHFVREHSSPISNNNRRANQILFGLINDILSGRRPPPAGFEDPTWWKAFLYTPVAGEDGILNTSKRAGKLAEIFMRARAHPHKDWLLVAAPSMEPRIPPVDLAAYPLNR